MNELPVPFCLPEYEAWRAEQKVDGITIPIRPFVCEKDYSLWLWGLG